MGTETSNHLFFLSEPGRRITLEQLFEEIERVGWRLEVEQTAPSDRWDYVGRKDEPTEHKFKAVVWNWDCHIGFGKTPVAAAKRALRLARDRDSERRWRMEVGAP